MSKNSARPIRGVVFDLDGTLLDTEGAYRAAFDAALAEFGLSLPPGAYDGLVGLASPARRVHLTSLLGPDFPAGAFFDVYYRCRSAALAGGIRCKPGVGAVLAAVGAAGLPRGIATSASAATALRHLAAAGLDESFDCLVTRDDVALGKPAPDAFLHAAALLRVAPEHCLAVEDSLPGMRAALDAGMLVVAIPDASACTLPQGVISMASLHELAEMIASAREAEAETGARKVRYQVRV